MSSLEQEAKDRKSRLAALRSKRAGTINVEPTEDKNEPVPREHDQIPESEDDEVRRKKPKLVQKNYTATEEEEQDRIEKIVLADGETVETVSKKLEEEILAKYNKFSSLDWWNQESVDEPKPQKNKLEDEYLQKLKLQELQLAKLTNESIKKLRKELQQDEAKKS